MISQPNLHIAETSRYRLRRLYHWLTYNRLTILVYGASFYSSTFLILAVLAVLALIFAPYMIVVLYKERRRGWLIALLIVIGVPVVLTIILIELAQFPLFLWYFPLVTYYLYCVFLRWAVGDWISDTGPAGLAEVQAKDRLERIDFDGPGFR